MKDLLIYYGYPNSFNSGVNGWNNENVAQDMSKYDLIVLGDGVQSPSHPDYANSLIIINRVKELNTGVFFFGYVSINQLEDTFRLNVEQWDALQIDGIFLDEAGYDYGVAATNSRDEFNSKISFVKSQVNAKLCFANAWNPKHILTREDDMNFPNSTFNPNDNNSLLDENDFYLMESFVVNTDTYIDDIAESTSWLTRGLAISEIMGTNNINIVSCGIINDDHPNGQELFDCMYTLAKLIGFYGVGTSDVNYGATNSRTHYWDRS